MAADLEGNRVIEEHIGHPFELDTELRQSLRLAGDEELAFAIRGPRGEGLLEVTSVTTEEGVEHVTAGQLVLASGARRDLFP